MPNTTSARQAVESIKTFSLITLTLLFVSACQLAPLDVQSVIRDDVVMEKYKTVSVMPVSNTIAQKNPAITLITKAIESELLKKGYVLSDTPELLFAYQLDIKEGEQLKQNMLNVKGQVFNVARLEAVYEAKMLVNAIDTKTKAVIWKASTSKDLRSVDTNSIDQDRLDSRMSELLVSFPGR